MNAGDSDSIERALRAANNERYNRAGDTGDYMMSVIVCFGDSLTAGFQSPTPDHPQGLATPYGDFLQDRLGVSRRIVVSGVCGEVTGEMARRFRRDVVDCRPEYVVILGGANDLGCNADPSEIMANLMNMYEMALATGIVVVPVTVPSIRVDGESGGSVGVQWVRDHIARRQVLNGMIRNYAASNGLSAIDLFTATADPDTLQLAGPYSNDGLHLTTEGYRLLASLVYDLVFASRAGDGERVEETNS